MFIILLLAALALIGLVATVIEIRRDGFRPIATDWSRVAEHDRAPQPESSIAYR